MRPGLQNQRQFLHQQLRLHLLQRLRQRLHPPHLQQPQAGFQDLAILRLPILVDRLLLRHRRLLQQNPLPPLQRRHLPFQPQMAFQAFPLVAFKFRIDSGFAVNHSTKKASPRRLAFFVPSGRD